MMIQRPLQILALTAVLASAAALPARAQVTINIGVAPPPVRYEPVPVLAPAQVWAPGYWAWNGDRYIWVHGRAIAKREGYRWAPDHWVQSSRGYTRQPGYWVRENTYVVVKEKKPKKPKHGPPHDGHPGHGHGHGPRH